MAGPPVLEVRPSPKMIKIYHGEARLVKAFSYLRALPLTAATTVKSLTWMKDLATLHDCCQPADAGK